MRPRGDLSILLLLAVVFYLSVRSESMPPGARPGSAVALAQSSPATGESTAGRPAPASVVPFPFIECRRASGPIEIDGKADEPAWKQAMVVDRFANFWSPQPAFTPTRAGLLWDDEYLYFFAEMEDVDLYADVTERDGETWLNDVFELFFKPAGSELGYYEFQVNAKGTQMDMFLPSRGSGGYRRWARDAEFRWNTSVELRGTLNKWEDDDNGWSAEGHIPWSDFRHTGGKPSAGDRWGCALCRYDYSKLFVAPQLSTAAPLTRADFHRYEDYVELRFIGEK